MRDMGGRFLGCGLVLRGCCLVGWECCDVSAGCCLVGSECCDVCLIRCELLDLIGQDFFQPSFCPLKTSLSSAF